jgi:hypothetical protein
MGRAGAGPQKRPRVFVCYRRRDSGYAGHLCERLVDHFGKGNVFRDIDAIRPGEDYMSVIERAVRLYDALVALIGPDWLTASLPDGRRRLDDPHDFVRLEIAAALDRKKMVVPALLQGASIPPSDELPDDVKALSRRTAIELTDAHWDADVARLIEALDSSVAPRGGAGDGPAIAGSEVGAAGRPSSPADPPGRLAGRRWLALLGLLPILVVVLVLSGRGGDGGPETPSRTAAAPVAGERVLTLEGDPIDAVIDPDGTVWVATVTDAGSWLERIDREALVAGRPTSFDGIPVDVKSRDGVVWVPLQDGILLRFDPGTSQPVPIPLGGKPGRSLFAFESLWMVLTSRDQVARIDVATNEVERVPVGDAPDLIAFSPGRVWTANGGEPTITPIDPGENEALNPVELPAPGAAMITFRSEPVVATTDGSIVAVRPTGAGGEASIVGTIDGDRPLLTRLLPSGDVVWAWQEGEPFLWAIHPGVAEPERHEAPFPIAKLATLGDSLWAVSTDGTVAELDIRDAALIRDVGIIPGRPALLLRDEERRRLFLVTDDGVVYRLST